MEMGIDPGFMLHRLDYWVRILLYWAGYFVGFSSYVLLARSWIIVGSHLNIYKWQRKLAKYLSWAIYFSIAHMAVACILLISSTAHGGNYVLAATSVSPKSSSFSFVPKTSWFIFAT